MAAKVEHVLVYHTRWVTTPLRLVGYMAAGCALWVDGDSLYRMYRLGTSGFRRNFDHWHWFFFWRIVVIVALMQGSKLFFIVADGIWKTARRWRER